MRRFQIDFAQPSKAQPLMGWLLLLIGLASLVMVGKHFLIWRQAQADAEHAKQQQVQAADELAKRQATRLVNATPVYVDDKRWAHAVTELALPWIGTLRAIERATQPPIYLLAFKSDPVSGRLLLEAEAPTFDEVLAYMAALQTAKQLHSTQLLSHQEANDAQGHALVRFSLQTQWVSAP